VYDDYLSLISALARLPGLSYLALCGKSGSWKAALSVIAPQASGVKMRARSPIHPETATNETNHSRINQNLENNQQPHKNRTTMLSRTAALLSKRIGHSISNAVSKQLAPAMSASSISAVSASSASSSSLSSKRQYTTHSQLPEEHQMIYEMCRNFANEELAPNAGEWDQKHAFPTEAITHMVRHPKR